MTNGAGRIIQNEEGVGNHRAESSSQLASDHGWQTIWVVFPLPFYSPLALGLSHLSAAWLFAHSPSSAQPHKSRCVYATVYLYIMYLFCYFDTFVIQIGVYAPSPSSSSCVLRPCGAICERSSVMSDHNGMLLTSSVFFFRSVG